MHQINVIGFGHVVQVQLEVITLFKCDDNVPFGMQGLCQRSWDSERSVFIHSKIVGLIAM